MMTEAVPVTNVNQDIFVAIAGHYMMHDRYLPLIMRIRSICTVARAAMDKLIIESIKLWALVHVSIPRFKCNMRVSIEGNGVADLLGMQIGSHCDLKWAKMHLKISRVASNANIVLSYNGKCKGTIVTNSAHIYASSDLSKEAAEFIAGLTTKLFNGLCGN